MEIMIKLFVIISLFVAFVTMPIFSKKDIHFGVRIPNIEPQKLKNIRRKYIVANIILGLIATYIIIRVKDPLIGMLAATFGYIIIFSLIYIRAYQEIKAIKGNEKGEKIYSRKRHVTVIDTNFTKEREKNMMVSLWCFLVPIAIILITVIISLVYYDRIPNPMPMHYNSAGEVDGWTEKTYFSVLLLPMISLAMTGIFYFVYRIIGKSKQQISAKRPRISSKQNRKFRRIWSGYAIGSATLMNILFAYIQLNLLRQPIEKAEEIMFVTLGLTLIMIIATFVIGIYVGNGGSKLKLEEEKEEEWEVEESDDDRYWKWGSIYYNPNDPSVFVEKRVGIGWTVNMGTKKGKAYIIGTLIFTVLIIIMAIMAK